MRGVVNDMKKGDKGACWRAEKMELGGMNGERRKESEVR